MPPDNNFDDDDFDDDLDEDDEREFEPDDYHFFYSDECDACFFLCSIILEGVEYDLWAHIGHGDPTVFARYGDDRDHNLGGASLGEALRLTLPSLPEDHQALRIAWLIANDRGLLIRPEAQDSSANTAPPA